MPTTRYVTGMLNEHARRREEASAEEHRILRRIVGKSQFLAPRQPDIAFATNRLANSLAQPSKSDIIASKRLLRYLRCTMDFGLKLQVQKRACSTLTVFTDSDWAGDRPTRKSVSSWVIMLDGFLLSAGARTQSVIAQSSCEAEYVAATAATSETKHIQALFLACGQHVNIHLRSDSFGAIGVASRRGLQRLTCDFCGCSDEFRFRQRDLHSALVKEPAVERECQHIIRCFWCFTLPMNLHVFVTEPFNLVHIFRDAHTVPFCLTADHILTCLMSLCTHQASIVLVCSGHVVNGKCSICSYQ